MSKPIEGLEGKRFGKLTVIKSTYRPDKPKTKVWQCQCDCGNMSYPTAHKLISGQARSCGCMIKETASKKHIKDLIGQKFGRLSVIERAEPWYTPKGVPQVRYRCKCDCGNIVEVFAGNLRKKNTQSCGCYNREAIRDRELIDLTGRQFGLLTVLKRDDDYVSPTNIREARWLCQCECGKTTVVNGGSLRRGLTKSCGCLKSSYGEYTISQYLTEHGINFEAEYSFNDLVSDKNCRLRFDFAILDSSNNVQCLIEFQGKQHYEQVLLKDVDFGKRQREVTDRMKVEYCRNHNILLYEIKYDADIEAELNWLFMILADKNMSTLCQAS